MKRQWIWAGTLGTLLTLSLLPNTTLAQAARGQKQYETALSGLKLLMPQMNAATRKTVPALKDILKRVFLDRAYATQSEIVIARPFFQAGMRAASGRGTQDDIDKEMQDVSDDLGTLLHQGLMAGAALFGTVSFELFGQQNGIIGEQPRDREAYFAESVRRWRGAARHTTPAGTAPAARKPARPLEPA